MKRGSELAECRGSVPTVCTSLAQRPENISPEFDFARYRHCIVAVDDGPMRVLGGLLATADADLKVLDEARTIIVPGWRNRGSHLRRYSRRCAMPMYAALGCC